MSLETSIVKCVFLIYHKQQNKYNLPFSLDTLHTHDRPRILENNNWRMRWTIEAQCIQVTKTSVASTSALSSHPPSSCGPGSANNAYLLVLKQIKEDCEQHKHKQHRE